METCTYSLNIQNKTMTFYSEEEMDSFLKKYYNVLSSGDTIGPTVFSKVVGGKDLSPAEDVHAKLNLFTKTMPTINMKIGDNGEKIVTSDKRQSVNGVLKMMAETDPNSGLTYFSNDNYTAAKLKQIIETIDAKNPTNDRDIAPLLSIKEALDAKLKRKEITTAQYNDDLKAAILPVIALDLTKWSQLAVFGTDLHKMAELFFAHYLDESTRKNLFTVDNLPIKFTELSEPSKRNYVAYLHTLKAELLRKHGEDAVIIPEYKVVDDNTNIVGVIDLLVVDSDGVSHIYDYKASYKEPRLWHSTKQLTYTYQLGAYRNMLKNKGISVGKISIIPIVMQDINYEENHITSIKHSPVEEIKYSSISPKIEARINKIIPVRAGKFYESSRESDLVTEKLQEAIDYNVNLKSSLANVDEFVEKWVHPSKLNPSLVSFKDRSTGEWISATPDKIRPLVEEYFKRESENSTSLMSKFKDELNDFVTGKIGLDQVSGNLRPEVIRVRAAMNKAFQRYNMGSWSIVMNDTALDRLGLIMLINEQPNGENTVEFVSYTVNELDAKVSLNGRNSILGKFVSDAIVETAPEVLAATNGNIELMKALFYINSNSRKFKDNNYKLGRIIAFNRNTLAFHTENLDRLKYNFEFLCRKTGTKSNIASLKSADTYSLLLDTFTTLGELESTNEFTKDYIERSMVTLLDKEDTGKLTALKQIEKDLRTVLMEIGQWEDLAKFDTKEKVLYARVQDAIVYEEGLPLSFESNMREATLNSRLFSAPGTSTSKGANVIHGIMENAMGTYRERHFAFKNEIKTPIQEFLESKGFNKLRTSVAGNQIRAYESLFRTIDNKVDPRLILKDPYDPESSLSDSERKFLIFFLEKVNKTRYNTADLTSDIAKLKISSGEWFELPLLRGNAIARMVNRNLTQKVKDYGATLVDPISLFDIEKDDYNKHISEGMFEMTNTFDMQKKPDGRDDLIQSENLGAFETDLEIVLLAHTSAEIRRQEYNRVLPLITSMKVAMAYQAFELGIDIENTLKYINNQTENVLYAHPHIMAEAKTAMKVAMGIKQVATFGNMAVNPITGLVNFMQGFWGNLTRTMARTYGENMYTKKEFFSAFNYVAVDSTKSIVHLTKLEELNKLYGLNNMDTNRLTERMLENRGGLLSMRTGNLYWFSSAPDYFNRMVLFVAQMKHDGCFEAHTIVDGELIYNFKEDKRFSIYASGDKNNPEYKNQKALYNIIREDFNKEGHNVQEGEDLPMAYNNKQRNSLKAFADSIHGHYDHSTKIQANNTILGILFFQFKTWMVAKKDQYLLSPMVGQQGDYTQLTIDGVKYYVGENGEQTTEDTGNPLMIWKGRYMEGIFVSIMNMFSELKDSNNKWDTLKALFKDRPTRSANMRLFAWDIGIVMAITLLAQLIDWPEIKEEDPYMYSMLRGVVRSANDLSVLSIIGTAVSSEPLPSISYAKDVSTSFWGAVTGDKHFAEVIYGNFGLTRPLEKPITNWLYPNE